VSAVSVEIVNLTRLSVDPAAVTRLVAGVLGAEGVNSGEIGVRFVGARRMRALNRAYLGHDEVTDVLSFPLEDAGDQFDDAPGAGDRFDGGPGAADAPGEPDDGEPELDVPRLLGDVVVCPTRAAAQARAAGTPLAFEIAMLLVHGTLHVLGYDHETDAGEMALRQAGYLDDASWERLLGEV
jgi:probable rRNA maturation factor